MPLVTFDYNDFLEVFGYKISKEELIEKLPMMGADLGKVEGDEINIEFFPNRPDLVSVEGIARAARTFFGFESGLKRYEVKKSDVETIVDPSVKEVRPYIATALIKNVTMSDELIASLMGLQEKLHIGIGRNRRKVAIGVHNFEPVEPPFTYKAVDPDSVQFVPLNMTESMSLREILKRHEKGREYAFILEGFDKHPLIVDKNNNVLSYPPIINGSLTEVTPFTTDIFIDVTGNDEKAVNYTLNIISTALAERGGEIYATKVIDGNREIITPDLEPKRRELKVQYVNKILGIKMRDEQVIKCLNKMGFDAKKIENGKLAVYIPAWRADILHEIDLVEDVAIGYGFDRFEIEFPKELTFGKRIEREKLYKVLRDTMIGLGFNEVTTFTISNEEDEFKKMGKKIEKRVEIENPVSEDYTCLRVSLIPSLLKILRANRHNPLPQQIFELGIVVDDTFNNRYNLSFVKIDAKANFTECKSYAEAILREIGKKSYKIEGKEKPGFINGRCARIIINGEEVAYFGELHPKTITNFELEYPTIAFELFVDKI